MVHFLTFLSFILILSFIYVFNVFQGFKRTIRKGKKTFAPQPKQKETPQLKNKQTQINNRKKANKEKPRKTIELKNKQTKNEDESVQKNGKKVKIEHKMVVCNHHSK